MLKKIIDPAQPRQAFTEVKDAMNLPDLVEIQKASYNWFVRNGLKELFDDVSPIKDNFGRELELSFIEYYLDEAKFDETNSKAKNITYEAPLRVKAKLVNKKTDKSQTQEIYLGDFPLMTDRGTFIINGIERAVVSQLIRSAGVFFTSEVARGRRFYGAKIIPNRGAWLELETDQNNVIWVKIDRKRKVAITSLIKAFGYNSNEEVLELFKDVDTDPDVKYIRKTLEKDVTKNCDEGLIEVYKRIRPGDLATPDNARSLIYAMFFNFDRYDFSAVGRYKINQRFGFDIPNNKETRILRREDLIEIVREIIRLNINQREPDDIDHLGNRRIRAVGELVQNKFRIGLARMERIVRDRMSTMEPNSLTPSKLINARPVIGSVKEFFMSSQLSQFMDQTNPLAELEHKRRLSAMGPGGLSRERASFDVRDVHVTHYGRICPIQTPEGPNIGLIGTLASYARVNEYGFVETPYRRIRHVAKEVIKEDKSKINFKSGAEIDDVTWRIIREKHPELAAKTKAQITDEIVYVNALIEEKSVTTAATTPVDKDGYFTQERSEVRKFGEPTLDYSYNIDFMDVSSRQIVSVATSLIPFLEHNDAIRALMGTNMQRQAVPCVRPEAPLVGTGIEKKVAEDSGYCAIAGANGKVIVSEGDRIEILDDKGNIHKYPLTKFLKSNQSTCINQMPIVNVGDKVKKGQIISDGPSTDHGELALGQNILVAFMAWEGYNYEDAIIISNRIVEQDRFTSIYIEDYSIDVRDTKLGPEVVTSDIPNVSEEKLKNLDAEGIVRIGAEVKSGDILVGKITPKGETELSPEEKLLRAIFGEKARDVRDSSLYLQHGKTGKVLDIKIFSREVGDKLSAGVIKTIQVTIATLRKVQVGDKLSGRHGNKGVVSKVVAVEDMPHMADGTPVDIILSPLGVANRMNLGQILETHLGLAAKSLGYKSVTPVFNGVTEEQIKKELEKAELPGTGKLELYDGRTGEKFNYPVTVGYHYMLKLNHMVEDKIHQRSIGPYSLITQQPLGGKAQFGGQRFGEMEVWAIEAYGAANTLQEILTIKSDDVTGRAKAYESIIKGEPINRLNVPESFNVLVRELKGLGLDVEVLAEAGAISSKEEREDVDEKDKKKKK